ncbi:DUF4192 domain-containing protein [Kutzneria kofuensis]|uniref:DUF4192 domain-containing protein n=1 Tax=Kutzneria kofuensis TaxID=103725 RepID=A0A7W9NJ12_9PSEU|nr:DUF4192 domain-containing protein [Kutzneria kofuensis]MBB5894470.1 hypothetical protein [Kutzneria kofuensis]
MDTAARPNPAQPNPAQPESDRPDSDRIVTLTDAGALIAAIPSLMGFHPKDSFVVVTVKNGLVGLTARMDLVPPPLYGSLVGRVTRPVRQNDADAAVCLLVCDKADPRHEDLMRRAVAALEGMKVPVLHALWTPSVSGGVPWRCYLHENCEGEVPDSAASELAAEMALAGNVTFDSRDDLIRLLEPPDPVRMIRLSGLLDTASRGDRTTSVQHLATIRAAIASGTMPSTDEEFVRLAMALSDYRVRDVCLSYALDRQVAPAAEKVWLELTRCLPPPERSEAAVLLAACAYLRGDGAMANVALEEARSALPGHNLAGLLYGAIAYGIPAEQVRQVLADAAEDAHIDIEGDDTEEAPDMST